MATTPGQPMLCSKFVRNSTTWRSISTKVSSHGQKFSDYIIGADAGKTKCVTLDAKGGQMLGSIH